MGVNNVLKTKTQEQLLSYIINVTPQLRGNIDLPKQGEGISRIGELILQNPNYRNAFINTLNQIGLTVISRNYWENPWQWFANKGNIINGDTIREIVIDIAKVKDYNEHVDERDGFLDIEVPNIYNYFHSINYQKYYKVSVSNNQIRMAFVNTDGLFNLIEELVGNLHTSYQYDFYIVLKYVLCKRLVSGTIPNIYIKDYNNKDIRTLVAEMKNVSELMNFMSPNYNPSGLRRASNLSNQILIMDTSFKASVDVNVLATSFFRNDAEFKTNSATVDNFGNMDINRLKLLIDYEPFTDEEIKMLSNIPAVIIDKDFFQVYDVAFDVVPDPTGVNITSTEKMTTFSNPQNLIDTFWLHVWKVLSTSPFANCCVFIKSEAKVKSIDIDQKDVTINKGSNMNFTVTINTENFANKAVFWEIVQDTEPNEKNKATISLDGMLSIPKDHQVTVDTDEKTFIKLKATSIYDKTKSSITKIKIV